MTAEERVLVVSKWALVLVSALQVPLAIPLILRRIEPNGTYGFRTDATLTNPDVWFAANEFMGWTLLVAGAISALAIAMRPARWKAGPFVDIALFLVPLLLATAASFWYLHQLV